MTLRSLAAAVVVLGATSACGGKLDIGSRGDAGAPGDSRRVVSVAVGDDHNCALTGDGRVRCWGVNSFGQLGIGSDDELYVGDDETPASLPDVVVGGRAKQVAVGNAVTCAVLEDGALYCWGSTAGSLGYGELEPIGDDEHPKRMGPIAVGKPVTQVATNGGHTCVVLDTEAVRCWGVAANGRIGHPFLNEPLIGDDELPQQVGNVEVGGPVQKVVIGNLHTCALLTNGAVRCWGDGTWGQLGYGNTETIGDDDYPESAGDVDLGGRAIDLAAGPAYTCAVLEGGGVRCWGLLPASDPMSTDAVGDDETPASVPLVDVGAPAVAISAGGYHVCVLLESRSVRCWGDGGTGVIGYGSDRTIGDDETPASMGDLRLGGPVVDVQAAPQHFCALLENGDVRCWGGPLPPAANGESISALLGQGDGTEVIGDDEFPDAYPPVVIQ
jgi:alpha-tubulin suppressor-like RCC1 family protein